MRPPMTPGGVAPARITRAWLKLALVSVALGGCEPPWHDLAAPDLYVTDAAGTEQLDAQPARDAQLPSVEEPPAPPDAAPFAPGGDSAPPPPDAGPAPPPLDCADLIVCVHRCAAADDECRRSCFERADTDARERWLDLVACWRSSGCPPPGDEGGPACAEARCADPWSRCGDIPDLPRDGGVADAGPPGHGPDAMADMALAVDVGSTIDGARPDDGPPDPVDARVMLPDAADPDAMASDAGGDTIVPDAGLVDAGGDLPPDGGMALPELDCPALRACRDACAADIVCFAGCDEGASEVARGRADRLDVCGDARACQQPDGRQDDGCLGQLCPEEWASCRAPLPATAASCPTLTLALLRCPRDVPQCPAEQWEAATALARSDFEAVATCADESGCIDDDGMLSSACLQTNCAGRVAACVRPLAPWPAPDPVTDCPSLAQCLPSCGPGGFGCDLACRNGAPDEATDAYDAVVSCADEAGCNGWQDAECVQEPCEGELAACFGGAYPPEGQWTCMEYEACLASCWDRDEGCRTHCHSLARRESVERLDALFDCYWSARCADDACLIESCGAARAACNTVVRPAGLGTCFEYFECLPGCATPACETDCRTNTRPDALAAVDALQACVDGSPCGGDRACQEAACADEIAACPLPALASCDALFQCRDGCGDDAVCIDRCEGRTPPEVIEAADGLARCMAAAGCPADALPCARARCPDEAGACFGPDGVAGVEGCQEAADCLVGECDFNRDGCACLVGLEPPVLEALLRVDDCRQARCAGLRQETGLLDCLLDQCADALSRCIER